MKRRNIFKYICLTLYVICSTLIIVHSCLNGSTSSNESNKVVNIFSSILNKVTQENNVYINVNKIELNSNLKDTYLGNSTKLDLNVLPSEASNKSLSFTSTDSSICTVDNNGNLSFNNIGSCNIIVTSNSNKDVSLTVPINVTYPIISEYQILIDGIKYEDNMSLDYNTYHYIDVISQTTIYKSIYSSNYVDVNSYGAFYLDNSISSFKIDVNLNNCVNTSLYFKLGNQGNSKTITNYSLNKLDDKLYVNSSYDLNYSVLPSTSNLDDLYYKIDYKYGEVKSNKLYLYKSSDNIPLEVISRSSGDLLYSTSLKIYDVFPTEIRINNSLDNDVLSLTVLNSTKLSVSFNKEATYKNVKYESGDNSILVIDDNGLIQTLNKGDTTIKLSLDYDNSHLEKTIKVSVIRQPYIKDISTFSYWVRKLVGHFGLFMVMSLFGTLTYLFFIKKKYISYPVSIFVSFVLACLSEFIQIYAGSRGPSFKDVGIDMLGASIPFVIILIIDLIIYLVKSKKNKSINNSNDKLKEE